MASEQLSVVKIVLTLFWDINRVILEHYMDRGVRITSISDSVGKANISEVKTAVEE